MSRREQVMYRSGRSRSAVVSGRGCARWGKCPLEARPDCPPPYTAGI